MSGARLFRGVSARNLQFYVTNLLQCAPLGIGETTLVHVASSMPPINVPTDCRAIHPLFRHYGFDEQAAALF